MNKDPIFLIEAVLERALSGLSRYECAVTAQTLSLRDCERITDKGIRALCKGAAAGSLLHLTVNACDRLTDVAALHMAAALQQLNTLSLEHCRHFTSRSAQEQSPGILTS